MMLLRLFFVCILQFVFIREVITVNLECYTAYDKGASYNGTATHTRGGIQCLNWRTVTNNSPQYFENHNYCRNPFNLSQPWCYTERLRYVFDYCEVPTCGCRQSIDDRDYRGHIGVTRNGIVCRVWNAYNGLSTANDGFCRTPVGDNEPIPWCYTDNPQFRWDRCNVPVCNGRVCPDLSNHHLEALDGKSRYQFGESVIVRCKDGYTMTSGQIYLTCLEAGNWNDTLPICEDCRKSETDLTYAGHKNITSNGFECINWSTSRFPNEDKNYCRTPKGDSETTPWCYTGRKDKFFFDTCDIPICSDASCPEVLVGHLKTKDGKTRYTIGETMIANCEDGYILRGQNTLICSAGGKWNYAIPNCERVKCDPVSRNDLIVVEPAKSTYDYKALITITCKPGFTGTEVTAVCTQAGKWSKGPPVCTRVKCDPVSRNDLIVVEPAKRTYDYKALITITCKPGFTGTEVTAVCTQAGKWSTGAPVCTSVTCGQVPNNILFDVQPVNIAYGYNETILMTCKPGFNGIKVSAVCTQAGNWSNGPPVCSRSFCPDLSNHHLEAVDGKSRYQYGESVIVQCKDGYTMINGQIHFTCLNSGKWNDTLPRCEGVTCGPNSKHISFRVEPEKGSYGYKETINISCKPGFTGSKVSAVCTQAGNWSNGPPVCTPVTCTDLMQLPNQKLEPVQIKYRYKDKVTFKCDEGYELSSANTMVTCQSDGTWSDSQTNCIGVPCSPLPKIDTTLLPNQMKTYRYPAALKVTCEAGFEVKGYDLLQCNSSGFWNSVPQYSCIEKSDLNKDCMEKRVICLSYGAFGGILTAIASISAVVHVGTCFYYRKQVGKPVAVYEDMQFNTVQTQNSSNENTYTELT